MIWQRLLLVTLQFDDGRIVELDQDLNLNIRISKNVLAVQNKADIDVSGLASSVRDELLRNYTAWRRRVATQGNALAPQIVEVTIEAGYVYEDGTEQTGVVYKGQLAQVDIVQGPPNVTMRICCFTRYIDKATFISTQAPNSTTFKGYVAWVAQQLGMSKQYICQTSFDNVTVTNPARSRYTLESLLWDIQDYRKPAVAAYIDDEMLIVKDASKLLNSDNVTKINTFIQVPAWTEYGVRYRTMLDLGLKLGQGCDLTSDMNPSVNGQYVITCLDYTLRSRSQDFCVDVFCSPPAQS